MNGTRLILSVSNVNNLVLFSVIEKPEGVEHFVNFFATDDLQGAYFDICAASEDSIQRRYTYSLDFMNPETAKKKAERLVTISRLINLSLEHNPTQDEICPCCGRKMEVKNG